MKLSFQFLSWLGFLKGVVLGLLLCMHKNAREGVVSVCV